MCDEVVRSYLEHFEPDYLVDLVGEGKRFFDHDRTLEESAVFDRSRKGREDYGLNINAVYQHHFTHDYAFVRRHPINYVLPSCDDVRVELGIAAAFGRFPKELDHYACNFRDVFEPQEEKITALNLVSSFQARTPIFMTSEGVSEHRRGLSGPAVFVLDGGRPEDVIDYWNLRALGWTLIPFPIQWEGGLRDSARAFLQERMAWYAARPYMRPPAMIMAARRVSPSKFHKVASFFGSNEQVAPFLQERYPPLWNRYAPSEAVERCTLSAGEDETEHSVREGADNQFVVLPPFVPKVLDEDWWVSGMGPQWAVVISTGSNQSIPVFAPVVPKGLADVAELLGLPDRQAVVGTEGITQFCDNRFRQSFRLPTPEAIAHSVFSARGMISKTSSAGRVVNALVQSLGGVLGAKSIAFAELLRKLDEMSHGEIESGGDPDGHDRRRRVAVRARSETQSSILGLLRKIHKNKDEVARQQFDALLRAGVFRLGLKLRCPKCEQSTWFPVNAIRDHLRCERCIHEFEFPAAKPPRDDDWTYRTQGPFSIENYALGSYAVVLALRALTVGLHHPEMTWIPSTVLTDAHGKAMESDFVAWHRDPHTAAITAMFGECKTFGEFRDKDLANARALSRTFPGAFQLFVTCRPEITAREKRHLRSIARAGRRRGKNGGWHTPVVVLTGRELFSDFGPPFCWHDLGEPFSRAASFCRPATDLLSLAQATQLAYLGLEPDVSRLRMPELYFKHPPAG